MPFLIDELGPQITTSVRANESVLVSKAGGLVLQSEAAIIAWPWLISILPEILHLVYLVLLQEVGTMGPAVLSARLDSDYATWQQNPGLLSITGAPNLLAVAGPKEATP